MDTTSEAVQPITVSAPVPFICVPTQSASAWKRGLPSTCRGSQDGQLSLFRALLGIFSALLSFSSQFASG